MKSQKLNLKVQKKIIYFFIYGLLIILLIPVGFYFQAKKQPFIREGVEKVLRVLAKGICEINIGEIEFDPLTLDMHVFDIVIKSPALGEVIKVNHLKTFLDFFNLSFEDKRLYAHSLSLKDFYVNLNSASISECFKKSPKETTGSPEKSSKPKDIKIEKFSLENGNVILSFGKFNLSGTRLYGSGRLSSKENLDISADVSSRHWQFFYDILFKFIKESKGFDLKNYQISGLIYKKDLLQFNNAYETDIDLNGRFSIKWGSDGSIDIIHTVLNKLKLKNISYENIETKDLQVEKTIIEYGKNGLKLALGKFSALSLKIADMILTKPEVTTNLNFSFPEFTLSSLEVETEENEEYTSTGTRSRTQFSMQGGGKIEPRGFSGIDLPLKFKVDNFNKSRAFLEKIIKIFDREGTFTFNNEEGTIVGKVKIF